MPSAEIDEVFAVDPDFILSYTRLLRVAEAATTEQQLLEALATELRCWAVAQLAVGPASGVSTCALAPASEAALAGNIVARVTERVYKLLGASAYAGESIILRDLPDVWYVEVDLIPLPRLADASPQPRPTLLYVLVDPAALSHIGGRRQSRDWQRAMIAQLIQGWWVKNSAPVPDLPRDAWAASAPLSRLVRLQIEEVQKSDDAGRYGPRGRMQAPDGFFAARWQPRLSGSPDGREREAELLRERAEALVNYWALWVEAHHALESEREAGLGPAPGRADGAGDDSVAAWVRAARGQPDHVGTRLDDLRALLAAEFAFSDSGRAS